MLILHPNNIDAVLFSISLTKESYAYLAAIDFMLMKTDSDGTRHILCTNNEVTKSNPNGIAYDVTSKRLKRVMTGECYDGSKDFKWNKDHQPLGDNLDVYEIEQVSNINQTPGECAFDVIDETLYGIDKLEPKEKIRFVCENFSVTQKTIKE